ncbi:MAG: hypothetical protein REJ50_24400 [Bordetella sp.]|nr:hypothetical protein [Bordetella sp.]
MGFIRHWRLGALATLACAASLLTGCAAISVGTRQEVRIDTVDQAGQPVSGATCELTNDRDTLILQSGQVAVKQLRRANGDMSIRCLATGQPPAVGTAISRANAGLAGDLIMTSTLGVIVDAATAAMYTYPTWMQLVFGEERLYDRSGNRHEGLVQGVLVRRTAEGPVKSAAVAALSRPRNAPPPPPRAPRPANIDPTVALAEGDALEYVFIEGGTGRQSPVVYRVDQVNAGETVFNEGQRVERADGSVKVSAATAGGLFELATPPRGWVPPGVLEQGRRWKEEFSGYQLEGTVVADEDWAFNGQRLLVTRIQYQGWTRPVDGSAARSVKVSLLYSPQMRRVVQFNAWTQAAGRPGVAVEQGESLRLTRVIRG